MSSPSIRALLIEDDPDDVLLLKEALAEIGSWQIKLDHADRLSRGLIQLGGQNYDVLLLDLNLPDSRGLDTLHTTLKGFPRLPVVVLSGLDDEAITIKAVRCGAQDYLVKGEINGPLVMRVLRYAIERKQVEAVLRASEARYRTLVETSPNGIILVNLEGNLSLCNQQTARMHGFDKPETMLGIHINKLISPEDRQLMEHNFNKTLHEGRMTNAEYTLRRKDGSLFPGEISTALLRNTSGAPSGFIGITRDITERKHAIEADKRLVMLQEEFLANVSRDFRIPLISLMRYIDLLHKGKEYDPQAQEEFLARVSRDAYHLLDKVNELLDFSLLESGQLKLSYGKVDFISVIKNALTAVHEQAREKRINLMSALKPPAMEAEVDIARMRRVLIRLLENAIKFSHADGKVLVTAEIIGNEMTINIIDEGSGISLDDCSKIFEKYYQVEHNNQQTTYAMGLGLYDVKQIVRAHGGTLTVSSQLGQGSTFILTLPIQKITKPSRNQPAEAA